MAERQTDLWIFAYGSLMWRPDFPFVEAVRADLDGYRRALCIHSHIYRGTMEQPGLVFGLDAGGTCTGVAFRVASDEAQRTIEAVRLRELVTSVYREIEPEVRLHDGRRVTAIAYAADPTHEQYAVVLSLAERSRIVRAAVGIAGRNIDYVRNTRAHLRDIGVHDADLEALCASFDDTA